MQSKKGDGDGFEFLNGLCLCGLLCWSFFEHLF